MRIILHRSIITEVYCKKQEMEERKKCEHSQNIFETTKKKAS